MVNRLERISLKLKIKPIIEKSNQKLKNLKNGCVLDPLEWVLVGQGFKLDIKQRIKRQKHICIAKQSVFI